MSITALTSPDTYMAAYSAVPIKMLDNDVFISNDYKYVVNICYDKTTITTPPQSYSMYGNVFTQITTSSPHPYELGDYLLLDDSNNLDEYTGYYIVKKIINSTNFVIDLVPSVPFGSGSFSLQKFIKYKFNPDVDGMAKADISNVLKDFVSQNLTGQTQQFYLSFDGPDTRFCYELYLGYEKKCVVRFDDNVFVGGALGFAFTGITNLNDICFSIGDTINIQQDLYGWNYLDNTFISGAVGFTGATAVPFPLGATINVTGQITNPSYNGLTTLVSIPTPNQLEIAKPFLLSSGVEPGVIYGVPQPSYNGVCNIINMYIDPILGYLIVVTDKTFGGASPILPGEMSFADNRITRSLNDVVLTGRCVFNAHLNKDEYTLTEYDKYTIQNRTFTQNNLSTICNQQQEYRILPETLWWLLQHNDPAMTNTGQGYTFYNNGNVLGHLFFSGFTDDCYVACGINQIGAITPTNDFGVPFSSYTSGITSYCIYAADNGITSPTQQSNPICFEVDTECTKYQIYHILWKDKLGSWISYPFKYVSRDNIESETKKYYQQEGNWENNTFGYDSYGRGDKNFFLRSRKSIIVNSGWLYEFERDLMADLIQSPFVYLQTPDGEIYGGALEEKKIEVYKQINEDLFAYSFNFIFASNEYRF